MDRNTVADHKKNWRCPYKKKLEPISVKIDVDKWAALKTGDVDIKKLEANPARPRPARSSAVVRK